MTRTEILNYEVAASWWCGWISIGWMQDLASRYFAWKVKRKWNRYQAYLRITRGDDQ